MGDHLLPTFLIILFIIRLIVIIIIVILLHHAHAHAIWHSCCCPAPECLLQSSAQSQASMHINPFNRLPVPAGILAGILSVPLPLEREQSSKGRRMSSVHVPCYAVQGLHGVRSRPKVFQHCGTEWPLEAL